MAEKLGTRIVDRVGKSFGSVDGNLKMFRSKLVGESDYLGFIAAQNAGAKVS